MKTIAVAILLFGFIAGCASQQAPPPSAYPSASATDRPDLRYTSPKECEKAGRTWNATSGTCM